MKSLHNKIVFLSSSFIGVYGSIDIILFKSFNFVNTSFIPKAGSFSLLSKFSCSASFISLSIFCFLFIESISKSSSYGIVSLNSSITLLNSFIINNSLKGFFSFVFLSFSSVLSYPFKFKKFL